MQKRLKDLIPLESNVKVYVPSTRDVTIATDNTVEVEQTLSMLSTFFGGATSYEAFGAWLSTNGQIVKERVTICESYCDQDSLQSYIDGVYDYCLSLKKHLSQEAIALEINGKMYFV